MLQGDEGTSTFFRDVVPNPFDDNGVEISSPSHEEVKIIYLGTNKAFPLNFLRLDESSGLFIKYGHRNVCLTIGTSMSSVLS